LPDIIIPSDYRSKKNPVTPKTNAPLPGEDRMTFDQFSAFNGTGNPTAPPDIPVSAVVKAYMDMGLSYEEAQYLVADNPQKALEYLQEQQQAGSGGGGGGGGGADNTVGLANNALGYAGLAQDDRHFNATFNEGIRQFDATYSRNAFESDRAYEQARYEYGTSFAENQRQFDLGYGLDSRSLDLQTELGRGNLALGQGRLGLDTELGRGRLALDTELGRGSLAVDQGHLGVAQGRLALDDRLGTGRLNLDTELGRGHLRNDTARVGLEGKRLALDDRLGTGRLNLDTELGRGQLGVNQQAEQRLQRGQVANERLANRDQELQRTQFVTDVLRKPSDFLARAFLQRGGTSPAGMVNQADILNNLKSSINQFAQGGSTTDGVFTTGEPGGAKSTEMVINPTNAPLTILNPEQTQDVMGGGGEYPGYEKGTLGKGKKKPGGIIGRLQDVIDEIEDMEGVTFNADVKLDTDQIDDQRNNPDPLRRNKKSKGKITLDPGLLKMLLKRQSEEMTSELGRLGATGRAQNAVPEYAEGTMPWANFDWSRFQNQGNNIEQGGFNQHDSVGERVGIGGGNTMGGNYQPRTPTSGGTGRLNMQPMGPVTNFGTGTQYQSGAMQPGSTPNWDAAMQATRSTIDNVTMPNVTQEELVQLGMTHLPPAAKAALFGGAGSIPSARPVGNLTLGRLSRLTPGEMDALNTQLGVQFNTDLETEIALLQERFGPVVNRQRGRLAAQ
jgi:hypothetical protein